MTATTGYQAGTESNDASISYAQEVVYGALPAVQFKAVRITGENLTGQKTRQRPGEILTTGEVAAATTTQESAAGPVNFALSYGTYDDWISGCVNNDWGTVYTINGVAADCTISAGAAGASRTITSTTAGKFTGLAVGQWVRLGGFVTNATANTIIRLTAVTGTVITFLLAPSTVSETPTGTTFQLRGNTVTNARVFKSFYIQNQFAPALFLQYPGSYISAWTLSGGIGNFLSGNFTVMAQQESSATVNASTGAVIAAPTGRVHDPVNGFQGVYLDGVPVAAVVDSFSISATNTGAKQEFGMGSSAAQGQLMGLLEVKGTLKVYFKDFTLYTRFKSETQGVLTFVTKDPQGNAYAISILAATIVNPSIDAGGPNTAVMASFTIEGNPQAGGGTIQIDRMPWN